MSDLPHLLRQYHSLVLELQQLEAKKQQLRASITEQMQRQGRPASIIVGDTEVRAILKTSVTVTYNEDGLRQRLGERYRTILTPDPRKIRAQLADLQPVFEPYLDTIGSVSRDLVAQKVQSGTLSAQDFAGLYTKVEKHTLYVKMAPALRSDADMLD
jgi:hypothetical protein